MRRITSSTRLTICSAYARLNLSTWSTSHLYTKNLQKNQDAIDLVALRLSREWSISIHLQSQIRFMLLDKEEMHFKNDKHLLWYRIICEKKCIAKVFCNFSVKRWVTTSSRLNSFLAVLDLKFYLLLYSSSLFLCWLALSPSATVLLLHILSPCSNPGSQKPCLTILPLRFDTAHWSGSLPDSACPRKFVLGEFFWAEEASRMSRYRVKRCWWF